jgi:hypothetical protein
VFQQSRTESTHLNGDNSFGQGTHPIFFNFFKPFPAQRSGAARGRPVPCISRRSGPKS